MATSVTDDFDFCSGARRQAGDEAGQHIGCLHGLAVHFGDNVAWFDAGAGGRIIGVTAKGHAEMIHAAVPLAEMLTYAPMLNSITGGRATYGMEFSMYEEVPRELAARVIEEHKALKHAVAL